MRRTGPLLRSTAVRRGARVDKADTGSVSHSYVQEDGLDMRAWP